MLLSLAIIHLLITTDRAAAETPALKYLKEKKDKK